MAKNEMKLFDDVVTKAIAAKYEEAIQHCVM
jgi:hypothetical protein